MNTQVKWIGGIVAAGMVAAGLILWLVLFNEPAATSVDTTVTPSFGSSDTRSTTGVAPASNATTNGTEPVVSTGISAQKIFKITDGPVAGAVLLQTGRPTTTIARFVLAQNGHMLEVALDAPGAVSKAVSNTTIPGITSVVWSEAGRGALMQYVDAAALKTAYFALPPAAATSSAPVRVQFLPAGVTNVVVSPSGTNIAYLIKTSAGSDGYTAAANGTSAKKLFSLPFSQLLLSWPSTGVLLAQNAPAAGVAGAVFSINATTGASSPILYAAGVTATANRSFSKVIYQTSDTGRNTYVRDTASGLSKPLSLNPLPEQCVWGNSTALLYCAAPLFPVSSNYIDLWHSGEAGEADGILAFDLATGRSQMLAAPGGTDGGEESNIAEMTLSADDKYLLFIRKGDRSLWAIRLIP